jgi:hypothetical protein
MIFSGLNHFTFTIPVPPKLSTRFPHLPEKILVVIFVNASVDFNLNTHVKFFGGMLRLSEYELPKGRFMFTN